MSQINIKELENVKYNTLIKINCDYCHKEFYRKCKEIKSSLKRGRNNFYCCEQCRDMGSRVHKMKSCKFCGKEFKPHSNKQIYCSMSCAAKQNKNGKFGKGKPKPGLSLYFRLNKKEKINNVKKNVIKYYKPRIKDLSKIIKLDCPICNKSFDRKDNDYKKSKNKLLFCSKSCRMKYYNKICINTHGCKRSKAEDYFINKIANYDSNIITNSKKILDCKLELDIFLPNYNLAIEINGPTHYFPIYGEGKLISVKNRDNLKIRECQIKNINLIRINISKYNSYKKLYIYLDDIFNEKIKPFFINSIYI